MFKNNNTSEKSLWQALNYQLNTTERRIIDYMLLFSVKNNLNYISQLRISKYCKVSIRTVQRVIRKAYALKIIVYKKQRGFNQTNLYKFNRLIFKLKEYLFTIFPVLKWCKKSLHKPTNYKSVALCLQGRLYLYNSSITMLVRGIKNRFSINPDSHKGVKNRFLPRIEEKDPSKGREKVMERSKPSISPLLHQITEALHLTEAGQLKILVFPEQALKATFTEYKCRSHLKSPFYWFLHYAKNYCITNKIYVDYTMWNTFKKLYNVPDNPIWVELPKPTPQKAYCAPTIELDTQAEATKTIGKMAKGWEFPYPGSLLL